MKPIKREFTLSIVKCGYKRCTIKDHTEGYVIGKGAPRHYLCLEWQKAILGERVPVGEYTIKAVISPKKVLKGAKKRGKSKK